MDPIIRTHNPLPMDPTINKITRSSVRRSSLTSIPTSFATVSLGAPSDPLDLKLSVISSAGFEAIELGFPDLVSFASAHHKKEVREDDYESLCRAGEEVQKLCRKHKLQDHDAAAAVPVRGLEEREQGERERLPESQRLDSHHAECRHGLATGGIQRRHGHLDGPRRHYP
jgi:hypothetical protein